MNSKTIGNIGEVSFLAEFVKRNIPVYIPYGDNEKADLIAEFNNKLQKIQIKTCLQSKDNKTYIIDITSSYRHTNNVNKVHYYTKDEIDYFGLYCVERDKCLLMPIEEIEGQSSITIRFEEPYTSSSRKEKDYLIDNILNKIELKEYEKIQDKIKNKNIKYCVDCHSIISNSAIRCKSCAKKKSHKEKGFGPEIKISREELKDKIRYMSFTAIGKEFNVSDNAIRKWCNSFNLPRTKADINKYSNEEWINI